MTNLGRDTPDEPKKMYKQFYFVDWVMLRQYMKSIMNDIDIFVDGQRSSEITWSNGEVWREVLVGLTTRPIRVRPWFEPGTWGGSWIKEKVDGLSHDVVNYAWSFELITPENGIILEYDNILLECSFDWLLFCAKEDLIGAEHEIYGDIFPIRFDFLDTFNGGNLSVQCHPRKEYMREHFGESITQEETYYILDHQPDAKVYLGFQDGVTPDSFRNALERSSYHNEPMAVDDYVKSFTANKHDLFLIPPGTIHASGKNTLVLEISSTPYIYTFKMYDWLRLDLDRLPRPLNIKRGMDNP